VATLFGFDDGPMGKLSCLMREIGGVAVFSLSGLHLGFFQACFRRVKFVRKILLRSEFTSFFKGLLRLVHLDQVKSVPTTDRAQPKRQNPGDPKCGTISRSGCVL